MGKYLSDIAVINKTFRVFDNKRDATAIIFLHGNSGNWQNWQAQLDYFQEKYRVVAFDHIGYGTSSPMPSDYSMMKQYEDTCALLDVIEVDRCHIVGLSMGGAGAQLLGLHGKQALSLCLVGIFRYDPPIPELATEYYAKLSERARKTGMPTRDDVAELVFSAGIIERCPEQVEEIVTNILKTDFAAAAVIATPESMAEIGATPISNIQCPCLVMAADQDLQAPLPAVKDLCAAIPNAQWCLVESSGHMMNIEQPDAFNSALSLLLESL